VYLAKEQTHRIQALNLIKSRQIPLKQNTIKRPWTIWLARVNTLQDCRKRLGGILNSWRKKKMILDVCFAISRKISHNLDENQQDKMNYIFYG